MANEPIFLGVFLGEYPGGLTDKSWIGYPSHNASSAGSLYLYNNESNSVKYITAQKNLFIKQARKEAKELAVSENKRQFAIQNLSFQIVKTEQSTELYADYYVLAW